VRPGLLTLAQLIEKCSPGPARILGLNAGRIAPGSPADITLFDPGEEWLVKPEKLHSKSRNTPYKGMRLYGRVKYTFCNGMPIFVEK
jgi:dihydroorotase